MPAGMVNSQVLLMAGRQGGWARGEGMTRVLFTLIEARVVDFPHWVAMVVSEPPPHLRLRGFAFRPPTRTPNPVAMTASLRVPWLVFPPPQTTWVWKHHERALEGRLVPPPAVAVGQLVSGPCGRPQLRVARQSVV